MDTITSLDGYQNSVSTHSKMCGCKVLKEKYTYYFSANKRHMRSNLRSSGVILKQSVWYAKVHRPKVKSYISTAESSVQDVRKVSSNET